MAKPEATYRTLEGDIELRLLNGRVVHTAPLSIREAKRLLGQTIAVREALSALAADEDADFTALHELSREFPKRAKILDEKIEDLGFELAGPDGDSLELGNLRLHDAIRFADLYGEAIGDAYAPAAARANVRLLDELPAALGIDPDAYPVAVVHELAKTFWEEVYLLIYGLAESFCSTLTGSPPARALRLRAPTETESRLAATPSAGSGG